MTDIPIDPRTGRSTQKPDALTGGGQLYEPALLNMSGRKGIVPEGAVYVGRYTPAARTRGEALPQSKFFNPFSVEREGRDRAVELYRAWLMSEPELLEAARTELRGRDLACWCYPEPCHATVLREIANPGIER